MIFNQKGAMRRLIFAAILVASFALPASASAALPTNLPQGVYTGCQYGGNSTQFVDTCVTRFNEMQSMGITRAIIAPQPFGYASLAQARQYAASLANARGIKIVWAFSYRSDRYQMRNAVNAVACYPATRGYYIADEPGQHSGEDYAAERLKVQNWAYEIKNTLFSKTGGPCSQTTTSDPKRNYVYTVHFGCDNATIDRVQKPYTTLDNVDVPMVDCYPYGTQVPISSVEANYKTAMRRTFVNSVESHAGCCGDPRKIPAFTAQAFDWGTEPGGSPNGLTGWPNSTAIRIARDCAVSNAMAELWHFSQVKWHTYHASWPSTTYGPTWATNTFKPAINTVPTTTLCDGQ